MTTIVRHSDGLGEMELRAPHPGLRECIVGPYQGFVRYTRHTVRFRELPTTFIPFIVNLADPWAIPDLDDHALAPATLDSFVAGLYEHLVLIESTGRSVCLQANLTPTAAHRIFAVPMDSLANNSADASAVLGRAASRLADRMRELPTWEARFALLDAFFLARLDVAPPISPGVQWALRRLYDTHGATPITTLVDEIGWSRKHLAAQFRRQVGAPPKTVARILRFQRSLQLLRASPRLDLADLARAAGYYDQAHLDRDFRQFARSTPTAFRQAG